jgi:hypothetical protein
MEMYKTGGEEHTHGTYASRRVNVLLCVVRILQLIPASSRPSLFNWLEHFLIKSGSWLQFQNMVNLLHLLYDYRWLC